MSEWHSSSPPFPRDWSTRAAGGPMAMFLPRRTAQRSNALWPHDALAPAASVAQSAGHVWAEPTTRLQLRAERTYPYRPMLVGRDSSSLHLQRSIALQHDSFDTQQSKSSRSTDPRRRVLTSLGACCHLFPFCCRRLPKAEAELRQLTPHQRSQINLLACACWPTGPICILHVAQEHDQIVAWIRRSATASVPRRRSSRNAVQDRRPVRQTSCECVAERAYRCSTETSAHASDQNTKVPGCLFCL